MEQYEECLKLQLDKNWRKEGCILSGMNPYFNYEELKKIYDWQRNK